MKAIAETLGIPRSNLAERAKGGRPRRGCYVRQADAELLPQIRTIIDGRTTFGIDTCDREIIAWKASTAAFTGESVRNVMVLAVEARFNAPTAPTPIEFLTDNGSTYTARETVAFAPRVNLWLCVTPVNQVVSRLSSIMVIERLRWHLWPYSCYTHNWRTMQIEQIEIRHFRSLKRFAWKPQRSNVICGINSSGKSNIRRALQFVFRETFDPVKAAENICVESPGPRTAALVRLTFDKPTSAIATALDIPAGSRFSYSIQVRRNGKWAATVNDSNITEEQRLAFLSEVLVVYVPPLRDVAANGLQPFLTTLTNALQKMRSSQSFNARAQALVSVVKTKGSQLLQSTRDISKSQLRVDQLLVDVDSVDLTKAFSSVGLKYRVGSREHSLDKLGTGHQSAVILEMYRQLGEASKKFVLYLFEEPDNHMHLTAMRAMVDDLELCGTRPNSQVVVTTHSPHMLNMFSLDSQLCLSTEGRLTEVRQRRGRKSEKELREAISRYGLTTAEAMLSRKILLVEGPADITLFRTLIELQSGKTAEQHDIHIASGSGKSGVKQLAAILQDLGANYVAAFDWDATLDTSAPMFKSLTGSGRQALIAQLTAVAADMRPVSPRKKSKPQKLIDKMIQELLDPPAFASDFKRSELGQFLSDVHQLNAAAIDAIGAIVGSGVRTFRPELERHRVWLWTASPEEILIPNQAAELVAAHELVAMGVLSTLPAPATQRATVLNAAHKLASEPNQQIRLIRKLWASGVVKRDEIKNAVKFCI